MQSRRKHCAEEQTNISKAEIIHICDNNNVLCTRNREKERVCSWFAAGMVWQCPLVILHIVILLVTPDAEDARGSNTPINH